MNWYSCVKVFDNGLSAMFRGTRMGRADESCSWHSVRTRVKHRASNLYLPVLTVCSFVVNTRTVISGGLDV